MSAVLVFVAVFLLFWLLVAKYKVYLVGSQLPGPFAVPLVGNVQVAVKLKPSYVFVVFTKLREKYGCTYRLWLGPQLWVFLHTPEETRDALNDPTLRKPDTFLQLNVLIGNGLLISHGQNWESHRKALGPAFHPNLLNTFTPKILQHTDTLIEKLQRLKGQSVEVSDYIFPCILDAVIDTSMGRLINAQKDSYSVYTQAFHHTSELLFRRMMNPLLAPDYIFKLTSIWKSLEKNLAIINQLMDEVIRERANFLAISPPNGGELNADEVGSKKRKTLLDILLTTQINNRLLSFQEIRDEANTFVFAGVDTTTAAMSFIIYALAKYPKEQEKLYNELVDFDISHHTSGPTSQDVTKLEYLDMFIKECLRLYTIVPATGRQTTTTTRIGNKVYCKGITLWINMYGLAHDPTYFPDPYSFKPERFSKFNHQQMPPFCYIPFSGGPHVCIGKRYSLLIIKLLTIRILQNFEVHLRNPHEDLILIAQMVLKAKNGINIIFKERNY